MKIALDAMGGDFGPPNIVSGAVMALREYSHLEKLFLVGDSPKIEADRRFEPGPSFARPISGDGGRQPKRRPRT